MKTTKAIDEALERATAEGRVQDQGRTQPATSTNAAEGQGHGQGPKRRCKHCLAEKPESEFHDYTNRSGPRIGRENKRNECKECYNNKRNFRRSGHQMPEGDLASVFQDMLDRQESKCAICKVANGEGRRKLCIDHCHKTGEIRGLLCHRCNRGLGLFADDAETMKNAVSYLETAK